jgi:hypothetical protein
MGKKPSPADRIREREEAMKMAEKEKALEEKITGGAQNNEDENPKSDNKNNPEPDNNHKSKPKENPNTELKDNPNHNPINNPTSNPNYEKVKYTDTKVQRAFYYDKNLIKIFDKHWPKDRYDKSKIMNDLLREFLV